MNLLHRLRALFRKDGLDRELSEEMTFHLEKQIELNMAAGMSAEEARYAALRKFGAVEQMKEECRDTWGVRFMETLLQDVRFGLRMLVKNPAFTAVAVLTLALGIGANTAIFSLLNAVMLRELPVQNPQQLVLLGEGRAAGSTNGFAFTGLYSFPFYKELREKDQVFSDVSAVLSLLFSKMHGAVAGSPQLEAFNVQLVSGGYFSFLGVEPVLGRGFTVADDQPAGGHPVAMLSYSWWDRRFGRDAAAIGKTVTLGATDYTIIGIAPPGFFGTTTGEAPDVWIPLSMEKQVSPGWNGLEDKNFESLYILGRLKPGVSVSAAQASINVLARQVWQGQAGGTLTKDQQDDLRDARIKLTPVSRGLPRVRYGATVPLQILMVVVGLVLLIACANIANLSLARATTREREIAVRMGVGASRSRLIRQMLTENVLLALCGGALGVLLAEWSGNRLLAMISQSADPLPLDVSPDTRVLLFTLAVSLATALLCGIAPALRATRVALTHSLQGGRGVASVTTRTPLSKGLIVAQVAISLVLMSAAGLFLRTPREPLQSGHGI